MDTGRKLNVHKTFSFCPVSMGSNAEYFFRKIMETLMVSPALSEKLEESIPILGKKSPDFGQL